MIIIIILSLIFYQIPVHSQKMHNWVCEQKKSLISWLTCNVMSSLVNSFTEESQLECMLHLECFSCITMPPDVFLLWESLHHLILKPPLARGKVKVLSFTEKTHMSIRQGELCAAPALQRFIPNNTLTLNRCLCSIFLGHQTTFFFAAAASTYCTAAFYTDTSDFCLNSTSTKDNQTPRLKP